MRGLSLANRLLLVAAVTGALAMALGAAALLRNAGIATRVEIDAGLQVARDYVIATVGSLLRDNDPAAVVGMLPGVLYQPRHVRIFVYDARTGLPPAPGPTPAEANDPPDWLRRLLAPPMKQLVLPIRANEQPFGEVVIRSDPGDEIAEVWQDLRALAVLAAGAYLATLLGLWLVARWTLRPLTRMAEGVERLGAGDYATPIGAVRVPELARLAARIDALGTTLRRTIEEKDELNRRLVSVSDEERRIIARELHDEFGPCLFGLRVETRSILAAANAGDLPAIEGGARSIAGIVDHFERANQALLKRLRPMELGELPLARVLEDLADAMSSLGPEVAWSIDIDPALDRYDETTELTLYRVAQEALTNALRHSQARRITFSARRDRAGWARLVVEDDGRGLPEGALPGNGLRGMRERIASVAGRLKLTRRRGGGSRVEAEVPLKAMAPTTGEREEMAG